MSLEQHFGLDFERLPQLSLEEARERVRAEEDLTCGCAVVRQVSPSDPRVLHILREFSEDTFVLQRDQEFVARIAVNDSDFGDREQVILSSCAARVQRIRTRCDAILHHLRSIGMADDTMNLFVLSFVNLEERVQRVRYQLRAMFLHDFLHGTYHEDSLLEDAGAMTDQTYTLHERLLALVEQQLHISTSS